MPGPGQYTPSTSLKDPSATAFPFGTEPRTGHGLAVGSEKPSNPTGPGMYHWENPASPPHWSFGNQKKGLNWKSDAPGPGQDDIPTTVPLTAPYAIPK